MKHAFSQICFVTSDIERIANRWADLQGAGPFYEFPTPGDGWVLRGEKVAQSFRAMLGFCGTTMLEFVQPIGTGPSFYRERLEESGDGAVHHVYSRMGPLSAEEFAEQSKRYEAQGAKLTMHAKLPMGEIAFFDARATIGCYLELMEQEPAVSLLSERMYAAHVAGVDGRLFRPFEELMG